MALIQGTRWAARCVLAVAACFFPEGGRAQLAPTRVVIQEKRTWDFPGAGVKISNDFSGARLNDCRQTGPAEFELTLSPENRPINSSPWYAFTVVSKERQTLTFRFFLTYKGAVPRPRLSRDCRTWKLLDEANFSAVPESRELLQGTKAVARIEAGPETLWVAAQEMIGLKELGEWMAAKARLPFASGSVIGHSIEGRPIHQLIFTEAAESGETNYVFIIGRQHPPEVAGSLGLMRVVDVITGESELAGRFRRQFRTVVIPVVNPDGVEHGHWRHNLAGVDTNRDWQPFNQQESRAARDSIIALAKEPGARPFVFLDFHATNRDVFYAQPDSAPMFPPGFTGRWLSGIQKRFPDYTFDRNDSHNAGLYTSKAWAHETLGIPGITYELGYNTDRDVIESVCAGAAEELMIQLLADREKADRKPRKGDVPPVQ